MIFQEFTSYSPMLDGETTRLSTVDNRGSEFFCRVSRETTKKWRALRAMLLDQLEEAIIRGDEPGEVTIELDI